MKKIGLLIICMLVMLPSIVSAHTHLAVSNPAEGQVVIDEIKDIRLTFDGNIEKLSSMKVLKDGTELTGIQVQIDAEKMIGTLSEPIENGAYLIQWNIAGEDGHPITGEINFTVQKEEKSEEQSTTVPDQGEDTSGSGKEDSVKVQITANGNGEREEIDSQNANNSSDEKSKSNTNKILTIIGFMIILGIGLLLLRKKK